MKLISAKDTIDFLGQAAPDPWVKRMLQWMIFNDEITPYFLEGNIKSIARVGDYLSQLDEWQSLKTPKERDAAFKKHFDTDVSDKLIGKDFGDEVLEFEVKWSTDEEPHSVGVGFFLYADEVDWETGTLQIEWLPGEQDREDAFFPDAEEHLPSEFNDSRFEVSLSGLNFGMNEIELLLPTAKLQLSFSDQSISTISKRRSLGRPPKWDWDGAMAHLVSIAQHPDGLPTGAGAQARVEEIIAEWFIAQTGESPSTSQIRQRAQKVMGLVHKD